MFPIIPHTLVNKTPSVLPAVGSSYQKRYQLENKPDAKCTVAAGSDIPRFSVSRSVSVDDLLHKAENKKIAVSLDKDHYISAEHKSWIRMSKLSEDCHSCNILLQCSIKDTSVSAQAVRDIRRGEHISLWFSEDILAMMGIPFLTPVNIQGEKNYICHLCGRHFEFPNPLKIHLALHCDHLSEKELWKRLKRHSETKEKRTNHSKPLAFNLKLNLESDNHSRLSTASNPSPDRSDEYEAEDMRSASEPPSARDSAFKPYMNHARLLTFPHIPATPTTAGESFLAQQAVEMETLVSNLGRSKQGHLCIYCGKVYSRKYGLKIHIRTHTGFKPLKCKYCLRPFGDPSNLNKHVRLHAEGETPYKCEQCGKILVRRRDLERHIKSRHQQDCLN